MQQVTIGNAEAYTALVRRHLPAIEVYARRMLADSTVAEDVAQDVMVAMWERAASFNPEKARLTTWLHRIAHNRCIDIIRKDRPTTDADELEFVDESAGQSKLGDDVSVDIALKLLPESQRTALALTYYQSLPNKEVSAIMGISTRAVESLLCRARAALRQQIEAQQCP